MRLTTLKKREEFVAIAKHGHSIAAQGVVIQALIRSPTSTNFDASLVRFGFTATRKTGNAVARNRIKRRLRAIIREILAMPNAPIEIGYDYVIIGRLATLTRPYLNLKKDMLYALHQVKKQNGEKALQ